jgi:hypothetical protein
MPRPLALAALILSCAAPCVHAEEGALGSVRLPLPAAELAASVGIHRVDPSSLPIDLVRLAFASPDNASASEAAARARLSEALARRGSGDPIPLPLSPRVWRDQILREQVRDDDLAARIFSRRNTALLYHGLLAVDLDTLGWIERNPAVVRSLLANPAAAAVFAESIVVRGGAIATPGEDAREVWTALVGADPAQPAAFVARLLSADGGAVAAFYHTIARLDPARQAFAIGRRGDPRRVERARDLPAASRLPAASWSSDRPFLRPDIDLLLLLRTITVDGRGVPGPPASRALWSKVFAQGSGAAEPIDAAWLARHVFGTAPGQARRRLEVFRFAQQMFGAAAVKEDELAAVLREHAKLPILFGVLATFDERDAGAYAAARRAASAVDGDHVATTVFQSALAIVDRARRSRTLDAAGARTLSRSLTDAAALSDARRAMAAWFADTLVPALRRGVGDGDPSRAIEQVVVEALAGPSLSPPVVVRWEDSDYIADLAPAELRRLLRVRRRQAEMPIDDALARARNGEAGPLAASLAALVYACALGDDGASASAGAVWRRHRFRGALASQGAPLSAWRLAAEVFAPEGWHVAGSLLRLDLALAPVALRRLDATEMPAPSQLSTSDRRTLATTIALIDPQRLTDADRDAIAAALARGRERIQRLATAPDDLDRVAKDAALSGWRRNGVAWLLATDPARVPAAFTVLEQLRAGGGSAPDSWGAASFAVDGCLCVRQPDPAPWEDYGGRASSGQLGSQLPDVLLRTADVLARHQLPALLARDVAAYAMQDAIDRARTAYFDDWLPVALAVRELPDDRFVDYIAALTVAGPLVPKGVR